MQTLKLILFATILTPILDFLWLGLAMSGFYKSQLGSLARMSGGQLQPIIPSAVLVYICIGVGVVEFVLPKVNSESPTASSLLWGALFGLVLYGTYEFTNHSLLQNWPLPVVFVDLAWGGILCAAVSGLTYWLSKKI